MRATKQRRRAFAICAAVLWLLGVEVLPNLHLAHHDHHHTHTADGSIVATHDDDADSDSDSDSDADVDVDEHAAHHARHADHDGDIDPDIDEHADHDVQVHEHGRRHDHHKRHHVGEHAPAQLAFDHVPHGHAAAGIAHHAIALHQPLPPITTPVAAPHAETWRHAEPKDRATIASAARPTARGPPV